MLGLGPISFLLQRPFYSQPIPRLTGARANVVPINIGTLRADVCWGAMAANKSHDNMGYVAVDNKGLLGFVLQFSITSAY
jgi:hypothetical protein